MAEPFFKSADLGTEENAENRIGQTLRYEREKQGLTVKDVAQQLCLTKSIIERLEAGDTDALPETVYVRGYIRAYCRLLGVDSTPLLDEFVPEFTRREEDDFLPAMNEHIHRMTRLWGSFTVLAVVVLLVSFWWMEQPRSTGEGTSSVSQPESVPQTFAPSTVESSDFPNPALEPAPTVEETAPEPFRTPAAEAEPPPAQTADKAEITIRSSLRSWAQLSDGAGALLVERMLPPGYITTVHGEFPLDFKFGDARGVRVWINGIEYDLQPHVGRLNTAFFVLEEPLQ